MIFFKVLTSESSHNNTANAPKQCYALLTFPNLYLQKPQCQTVSAQPNFNLQVCVCFACNAVCPKIHTNGPKQLQLLQYCQLNNINIRCAAIYVVGPISYHCVYWLLHGPV